MTVADPDLSPAMRTELVASARRAVGGLYVVICHEHTRKALVRRGLAEERDLAPTGGRQTILTREGSHAAARVVDEDNPVLKPGSVVTYHGSRPAARGRRLIVVAVTSGTYAVCSDDPAGAVRLGHVRRESLRFTGELVDLAARGGVDVMRAHRDGRNVALVMTAADAKRFENELLWGREDDTTSKRAWKRSTRSAKETSDDADRPG